MTIAVIFAGGFGSRLGEETHLIPKPLIKIGNEPILIHIIKIYSHYKIKKFIICLGYKGDKIIDYFLKNFKKEIIIAKHKDGLLIKSNISGWEINFVKTGLKTQTGGRLKKIYKYIKNENFFCFTYGDGVAKINISKLISFHINSKKLCTITAINPKQRFGILKINKSSVVKKFSEKPISSDWINGGFFVASPKVIKFVKRDSDPWEMSPLKKLVKIRQLVAYKFTDFWYCMDTLRDKQYLNNLIKTKRAVWKIW
jgi:glucose-1-phosphate cytidylyltransferase